MRGKSLNCLLKNVEKIPMLGAIFRYHVILYQKLFHRCLPRSPIIPFEGILSGRLTEDFIATENDSRQTKWSNFQRPKESLFGRLGKRIDSLIISPNIKQKDVYKAYYAREKLSIVFSSYSSSAHLWFKYLPTVQLLNYGSIVHLTGSIMAHYFNRSSLNHRWFNRICNIQQFTYRITCSPRVN